MEKNHEAKTISESSGGRTKEFEVESILAKRPKGKSNRMEYLVKGWL
jgi:hypothetical protein